MLARSAVVRYLVVMRKGNTWGISSIALALAALVGTTGVQAQTGPAAPLPAAPASSSIQPSPVATEAPRAASPESATNPAASPAPPLASPAAASAPTSVSQAPQPPLINLQKDPPLPPPVARTDRVHDGLYARLSLGLGSLSSSISVPQQVATSIEGSGMTLALDVAVGYAVSPGIVLGGTLLMEKLSSTTVEALTPVVTDISAAMLGPFFDGYPDPRGGFHLGGGLGFARNNVQRETVAGFKRADGYGLAGWVGYDMWVADQWSTGLLLRVMGTRTKNDSAEPTQNGNGEGGDASMGTQSIAFLITGLYN